MKLLLIIFIAMCFQKTFADTPEEKHVKAQRKEFFISVKHGDWVTTNNILQSLDQDQITNLLNSTDSSGSTPLHHAFRNRNFSIAIALIDTNANIDLKISDNHGWTVFHEAVRARATIGTLKKLLKRGADINAQTQPTLESFKKTPLHIAILNGYHKLAVFLIRKGADPNTLYQGFRNHTITPIQMALKRNQNRLIRTLILNGADPNTRHMIEITPALYLDGKLLIEIAVIEGDIQLFLMLMDAGANLNPQNSFKNLHQLAIEHKHPHIAQLLEEAGAVVYTPPKNSCRKKLLSLWRKR